MKLRICLPVPDNTKSYMYGYERKLQLEAMKIMGREHPNTKAYKYFLQNRHVNSQIGYNAIYGQYIFVPFMLERSGNDEDVWLDPD